MFEEIILITIMQEVTSSPIWVSFVPLIIMTLVLIAVSIYLIGKKGKSMSLLILAFIPLVNSVLILYLLAQTNKTVLDDIERIKKKLEIE